MKLSDIIDGFLTPYPAGLTLDRLDVESCLMKAVRMYAGYSSIAGLPEQLPPDGDGIHSTVIPGSGVDGQDVDLNHSELAIIMPLFERYVERQNATNLEASRGLGVDVYGRSVAEVQMDINQLEMELPQRAFKETAFTI